MINKNSILILLLNTQALCAISNSFMIGVGPGVYNTENKVGNLKLNDPNNPAIGTTSLFKTKPAPFIAVAFSETLKPHDRCALSILITGGVLPSGKACFITTAEHAIQEKIPACFSGHFFISAYGSSTIDFPVTTKTSLQLCGGYGLNSEYLDIFLRSSKKLFSEFNRQFTGPFVGLTATHTHKKITIAGNYQCMIGTTRNNLLYYSINTAAMLTIPCIMNSISLSATYTHNDRLSFSINGSYSRLENYKRGSVSLCVHNNNYPSDARSLHYFINSFALYIQGTITY